MSKRESVSEEDAALFRAAAGEVRALDAERTPRYRRQAHARPRSGAPEPTAGARGRAPANSIRAPERDGEQLFVRAGLQQKQLRRLRRGQIPVDAEVDLHGMRLREAHALLDRFMADCRSRGRRCVRIIHGKGNRSQKKQPVLKGKVNGWLRQKDEVLAFCSARRADGGTGAAYVLLKRKS